MSARGKKVPGPHTFSFSFFVLWFIRISTNRGHFNTTCTSNLSVFSHLHYLLCCADILNHIIFCRGSWDNHFPCLLFQWSQSIVYCLIGVNLGVNPCLYECWLLKEMLWPFSFFFWQWFGCSNRTSCWLPHWLCFWEAGREHQKSFFLLQGWPGELPATFLRGGITMEWPQVGEKSNENVRDFLPAKRLGWWETGRDHWKLPYPWLNCRTACHFAGGRGNEDHKGNCNPTLHTGMSPRSASLQVGRDTIRQSLASSR